MSRDQVNHPEHYQSESGIECIDFAEHLNFCTGNAFKYVWRGWHDRKGNGLTDLKKAKWYLEREISRRMKYESTKYEEETYSDAPIVRKGALGSLKPVTDDPSMLYVLVHIYSGGVDSLSECVRRLDKQIEAKRSDAF